MPKTGPQTTTVHQLQMAFAGLEEVVGAGIPFDDMAVAAMKPTHAT